MVHLPAPDGRPGDDFPGVDARSRAGESTGDVGSRRVGEVDVSELDRAVDLGGRDAAAARDGRRAVDELEDALGCAVGAHEVGPQVAEGAERRTRRTACRRGTT